VFASTYGQKIFLGGDSATVGSPPLLESKPAGAPPKAPVLAKYATAEKGVSSQRRFVLGVKDAVSPVKFFHDGTATDNFVGGHATWEVSRGLSTSPYQHCLLAGNF
jgi:hypothetical protein